MLIAERLEVAYQESVVLRGISLAVPDGSVVCLMGRNGAGKTTLLKSVMGLLPARRGSITLNGEELASLPPDQRARRGIGYVPQGREIFPFLTVRENLLVGLQKPEDEHFALQRVLGMFPALNNILSRIGGVLSGGQQQQLAIARALINAPRFLLLDEPTEGIQPSVVTEIERAVKSINWGHNVSILLVEQYLDFALRVADFIYVIETGQIVWQGSRDHFEPEVLKDYLAV